MTKRTLVVLAAGMGSRFGGIKQIEPVGPNGEIIADYSVYDAIRNGFERVVFVIKEEHLDIFQNKICNKYKDKVEVCFAFQKLDSIPNDVKIPEGRVKMWGTAHALLAAKPYIDEEFLMINADDFYGSNSYLKVKEFFDNNNKPNEYITVNYPFNVVSSEKGKVKRGVAIIENNIVKDIIESEIGEENGKVIAYPLNGNDPFEIKPDAPVSMNFFGLKSSIFNYLETDFDKFIHGKIDEKSECLMPDTLKKCIYNKEVLLYNAVSNSKWCGMTYKEDLESVKKHILKLIEIGEYPNNLWG